MRTDQVDMWKNDPVVRSCGGLHAVPADEDGDAGLVELLRHVFDTNVGLLTAARPELKLDDIALLVTAGERRRALAYRSEHGKAVVIDIGLLRAFWTRVATVAHLPTVLAAAFPLESTPPTAWLSPDCPVVPGTEDWGMPQARIDYCFEIMTFMLEYVVLHELAHHMRGHLDLSSGASAIALIDESIERDRLPRPSATASTFALRDIEFDADAHGLDLSLCAMNEKFPFAKVWTPDDAADWLFDVTFAQILVAQLLDGDGRGPCDRSSDGHPAPVYRSINYSNLAARSLHRVIGGGWEAYRDNHDAAWYESSLVAEALDYPDGRWHGADGVMRATAEFAALERQYFEASGRLDRAIDHENGSVTQ